MWKSLGQIASGGVLHFNGILPTFEGFKRFKEILNLFNTFFYLRFNDDRKSNYELAALKLPQETELKIIYA